MNIQKLLVAGMVLCGLFALNSFAFGQGTAFTYQGRLNNGANPANGTYDLTFSLFATNVGGGVVAGPITNSAIGVTNGLFITTLDFGGVFSGQNCWLDISVRTNGSGAFTELHPRQPLTPAPYAIFANTASNLLGTLPAAQLTGTLAPMQLPTSVVTNGASGLNLVGTFSGNGAGLTGLSASQLTSGTVPDSALSPDVSKNPDAYTVTWTTNSNPYSANYYSINAAADLTNNLGTIHWLTCVPVPYLSFGFINSVNGLQKFPGQNYYPGLEFGINGSEFVIVFGTSAGLEMQVNEGPVQTFSVNNSMGAQYMHVVFNTAANRLIRMETSPAVIEIDTPNTNGVVRRNVANNKILFIGDSKTQGPAGVDPNDTWDMSYSKIHPTADVWQDAIGGTGLLANGSYTNYQGRIFSDFTNGFQNFIVCASINDGNYTSNQIVTAATLLFQTIKSNAPNAFIGCIGNPPEGTPGSPADTNLVYSWRAACLQNGIPYLDLSGAGATNVPYANPIITGYYQTAGSGNAYQYILDGTHPNTLGMAFIEANVDDFVTTSVSPTINPLNANLTGAFTGNGGGLTNLSPQNITTINSPVNGYALRYTNGAFYWAP
jgi:lysophospholipase L1-like esterase